MRAIFITIAIFVIVAMVHYSAVFMQWITNSFLEPSEPVTYGLCLFVSIVAYFMATLYIVAKVQEADQQYKTFMRIEEMKRKQQ